MSARSLLPVIVALALPALAQAQEQPPIVLNLSVDVEVIERIPLDSAPLIRNLDDIVDPFRSTATRPKALALLYVGFVSLQALDTYTTWRGVSTGRAREANQALRGIAGNLPALITTKLAATAVTVYATERLWKRNRKAAVFTLIGVNAAYAVIVSHNASVLRGGR